MTREDIVKQVNKVLAEEFETEESMTWGRTIFYHESHAV